MIYDLTIRNSRRTPVPHWNKVSSLKACKKFEFKPGLNIIYGENGSGKSTLLKALAIQMHVWLTNWPVVSKHSLLLFNRPNGYADGMLVDHDGAPARYLGIDEPDFAPASSVTKENLFLKPLPGTSGKAVGSMSQGQASVSKLIRFLKTRPDRVRYAMTAKKAVGDWEALFEVGTESLKNKAKRKGVVKQQVILLDEVDRSLDAIAEAKVWKQLRALAVDHQIIIASHSEFARNVPGANYIETSAGYLAKVRAAAAIIAAY